MPSTKKEGPLAEARALIAGVMNQPGGDLARARRLIDRALRETPLVDEEQRRIAAIVASRLHIYSPEDMELFCSSYWDSVGAIAGVVKLALPPQSKSADGKRRRRLGPTSIIARGADLAAERKQKPTA